MSQLWKLRLEVSEIANGRSARFTRAKEVTIAMVTHDPVAASYCERILFIREWEIFSEIHKGRRNKPFPRNSGRTCDARRRIS